MTGAGLPGTDLNGDGVIFPRRTRRMSRCQPRVGPQCGTSLKTRVVDRVLWETPLAFCGKLHAGGIHGVGDLRRRLTYLNTPTRSP